jgi:hypothetical protein
MVFLIAYALFEVPSNYFLKKLRPSVCHKNLAFEIRSLQNLEMDCVSDAVMGRVHNGLGRSP